MTYGNINTPSTVTHQQDSSPLKQARLIVIHHAICFAVALCIACGNGQKANAQILAAESKLKLISDAFKFTEGPTADNNGNVLFTDQPNNQILFYDFASDTVSDWLKPAGRSNGLFFTSQRLIACADEKNELWEINPTTKQTKVLCDQYKTRTLAGPNDCWVDTDGAIYFTDPLYQRPYWKQVIADDHPRGVYRVNPQGEITQVVDDLIQPNGIIGDARKRVIYIADINAGKTYRYRIKQDGTLIEKTLFCNSGSDGMTIDREGNVYLTGKGVSVFNEEGKKITSIPVPKRWTANVTFSGPERKHLFITAGNSVYVIKTQMTGL